MRCAAVEVRTRHTCAETRPVRAALQAPAVTLRLRLLVRFLRCAFLLHQVERDLHHFRKSDDALGLESTVRDVARVGVASTR